MSAASSSTSEECSEYHLYVNPSRRELRTVQDFDLIDDLDFLIVKKYYEKFNDFENKTRVTLAKVIMKYLLSGDINRHFDKRDFVQISSGIKLMFPSEVVHAYYTPSVQGKAPKGKLYDAYCSYRKDLAEVGLILRREKKQPEKPSGTLPTLPEDEEDDIESIEECLTFLQNQVDPWEKVLQYWELTSNTRLPELFNNADKDCTYEYFHKYPVLKDARSNVLFSADVKKLHPNVNSIENWDNMYEKILVQRKPSFPKDLFGVLDTNPDDDTKKLLAILMVPYLLPCSYVKKKKLSKFEVQSNFIGIFKTVAEYNKFDDDLKKQSLQEKTALQPRIYLTGDISKPNCFVIVCNQSYSFENPFVGFQFCFNSFFALNLKYPEESQYVWTFFQKAVFEIITNTDVSNPQLEMLIANIHV